MPQVAYVLACLISDAQCGAQSFEDFCSDLGYDTDSMRAHETWEHCVRTGPRLRRFLGDLWPQAIEAARDH